MFKVAAIVDGELVRPSKDNAGSPRVIIDTDNLKYAQVRSGYINDLAAYAAKITDWKTPKDKKSVEAFVGTEVVL